jgi:hypothetical protein
MFNNKLSALLALTQLYVQRKYLALTGNRSRSSLKSVATLFLSMGSRWRLGPSLSILL